MITKGGVKELKAFLAVSKMTKLMLDGKNYNNNIKVLPHRKYPLYHPTTKINIVIMIMLISISSRVN